MPFYEYRAVNRDQSCDLCADTFEIIQSMSENSLVKCPECKRSVRKIFSVGAVIMGNKEANQYADIKSARYWRDKNGIRHQVTQADGYSGSATVSRQTATSDDIKAQKKKDRKKGNKDRLKVQQDRVNTWNRKQLEK